MDNKLQLFNFEGKQVRALEVKNEPWFVGKDAASILGYSNTRDALNKHVDSEDKNTVAIHDGITRGNPNQVVINESGLYSLILSSKMPNAKKFKHWVTSEVLPAIRKHGIFATEKAIDQMPADPDSMIKVLTELKKEHKIMVYKEKEQVIWKPYPDYPFIEANQFGEIRTLDRYVPSKNGSKQLVKGRVLKQQLDRYSYLYVSFGANGKTVHLKVHRIVATCFIPNPDNYSEVNHKDNNPTNNRLDNLEWCTSAYNNAYREKYGTACSHPVIAINLDSFKVLLFRSQNEAARQLGVRQGNINSVVKGRRQKTAGGYWFCDADSNAVEKVRAKFDDEITAISLAAVANIPRLYD